jgi:hypothetical protein
MAAASATVAAGAVRSVGSWRARGASTGRRASVRRADADSGMDCARGRDEFALGLARRSRQIELALQEVRRWGGRRRGAGRKPGPNPGLKHESREAFAARARHAASSSRRSVATDRADRARGRKERCGCVRASGVPAGALLPREVYRALRYVLLNARRHVAKAKGTVRAALVQRPRIVRALSRERERGCSLWDGVDTDCWILRTLPADAKPL